MYGPYQRPDGRFQVVWVDKEQGIKTTQSFPRYLMEKFLGRKLLLEEHVDHINNDPTDNRLENLQLLSQSENSKKSARPVETSKFKCPICEKEFLYSMRRYRHNQLKQGKRGPYCSKRCAGIASHF